MIFEFYLFTANACSLFSLQYLSRYFESGLSPFFVSYIEIFNIKILLASIKLFLWLCDFKHVRKYNVIGFVNFTRQISFVSEPKMDLNRFQY